MLVDFIKNSITSTVIIAIALVIAVIVFWIQDYIEHDLYSFFHNFKKTKLFKKIFFYRFIESRPIEKYRCGHLFLDIKGHSISYKLGNIEYFELSNQLKLLKLLLEKSNSVVSYPEIAKYIDIPQTYKIEKGDTSYIQYIQDIKSELVKLLKRVGMPEDLITQTLLTKRGVGYKLLCNNR